MLLRRFGVLSLASVFALTLAAAAWAQNEPPPSDPPANPQKPDGSTPETAKPTTPDRKPLPPAGGTRLRPGAATTRVSMEVGTVAETWGTLVIELDEEKAPVSCRNFLRYVDEGFYDNTLMHRVLNGPQYNALVQGGGYMPGNIKKEGVHEPIICESRNKLRNLKYAIAIARGKDPNSGTSQFFINCADNPELDYPSHDGMGYAVFGRVVEGIDVVDRIHQSRCRTHTERRDERSVPITPVIVKKAKRWAPGDGVESATPPKLAPPKPLKPTPPPPEEPGEKPEDTGEKKPDEKTDN